MQKANWKTNDLASTKITKKVNGEDMYVWKSLIFLHFYSLENFQHPEL